MGTLPLLLITALVAGLVGKPLFYWGARPPAIHVELADGLDSSGPEAAVREVHTALRDDGDLLLRLTFDRSVHEASHLPDGTPVSGRLQAILYLDTDGDRSTGLDAGAWDLRTGADRRVMVGVVSLGEDAEEGRAARALVVVALSSVSGEFYEQVLWRADDEAQPENVSWRGEWLELRLPSAYLALGKRVRLVLAQRGRVEGGALTP